MPESRLWLLWEQNVLDPAACGEDGLCGRRQTYTTRLLEETSTDRASQIVSEVDRASQARNMPLIHPEAPKCTPIPEFAAAAEQVDYEALPESAKIDTLRGLTGVYFDMNKAKGPDKKDDSFGPKLHNAVVQKFTAAGLKVLTKEELETTPGKPIFKASFSPTRAEGCWWRVSAGLTQTLLLSRDQMIKIRGSTWGASGSYRPDDETQTEWNELMKVVDRFVEDWTTANNSNPQVTAKK